MNEQVVEKFMATDGTAQSTGQSQPVLSCEKLTRSFEEGGRKLDVLRGIDM